MYMYICTNIQYICITLQSEPRIGRCAFWRHPLKRNGRSAVKRQKRAAKRAVAPRVATFVYTYVYVYVYVCTYVDKYVDT